MMKPTLLLVITLTVAGSCATSAAAVREPFVMRSATVDAERVSITLVDADGRQRTEQPETAGDTFGVPALSDDGRTVGWTVERIDGASYPYPEWLQFIHHGARRRFDCRSGMPWAWRYEGNDRIVVDCALPHGDANRHRVLVDIGTGRILGDVALKDDEQPDRKTPAWARREMPVR